MAAGRAIISALVLAAGSVWMMLSQLRTPRLRCKSQQAAAHSTRAMTSAAMAASPRSML